MYTYQVPSAQMCTSKHWEPLMALMHWAAPSSLYRELPGGCRVTHNAADLGRRRSDSIHWREIDILFRRFQWISKESPIYLAKLMMSQWLPWWLTQLADFTSDKSSRVPPTNQPGSRQENLSNPSVPKTSASSTVWIRSSANTSRSPTAAYMQGVGLF